MAYSKSVIRRAESILGYGITEMSSSRTYPVIDGVVYTDLFQGDVEIEGYTGTIKTAFNGKYNGLEYFNEIHLSKCSLKEVTLDLDWGADCFFKEIDALLMWLSEDNISDTLSSAGTKSLKIEDYAESFSTAEEKKNDVNLTISDGFSYYIRRPFIIDVAREQKDGSRYF